MQFILLLSYFVSVSLAINYATYPQVPKTASINGFADPIFSKIPSCAQDCVKFGTGNTPCPYWDTGCLCVMPQWSGLVAQCVAQNCKGSDVADVASLATSLCSSVGANTWMMPGSISTELSSAAGNARAGSADASTTGSVSASTTASGSGASSGSGVASSTQDSSRTSSSGGSSSKISSSSSSSNSATASGSSSSTKNSGGLLAASALAVFISSLFSLFL
ncbi:CFEM-domain-containing protein [Suhomyces tanzawaensis NRRL Y-17324]|uniref:CFEM-domain-containing protein n=1 Tax=Suhomyces tanzawaensis NRRL Y-17324 TaxID=984487 RepID=A0A1E4SDU1_9ASCO|nr:CFEM-domain-containing protein [Suhomyces tanzawaensis NRRL Y-17324]ODV77684.1 CFEM-domain-containing protein [Suhomyces tanzawaensis NRRL Y-17324]